MGIICPVLVALRRPSVSSSRLSSSPPRYFSISLSSISATASISFSRKEMAWASTEEGISASSAGEPR